MEYYRKVKYFNRNISFSFSFSKKVNLLWQGVEEFGTLSNIYDEVLFSKIINGFFLEVTRFKVKF